MSILNRHKHSPPRPPKGWAMKTLASFWRAEERRIKSFRSSTRHGVCSGCCFSAETWRSHAISVATVSSVLLINCAMTNKAVTSFSPLHPDNIANAGLSVMLNYTGWLVVTQWCRQITNRDQGWTLATKLVSLVTHSRLKIWLLLTFY